MNASATINGKTYALSPLDVIRIVASQNGFVDVDCEPEVAGYKIVAAAPGRTVTARGQTMEEVCEKFCQRIA